MDLTQPNMITRLFLIVLSLICYSSVYAQDEAPMASNSSRIGTWHGGNVNVFYRQLVLSPTNPSLLFASTSDNTIEIWNMNENRMEKSFPVGQFANEFIVASDALYIAQSGVVTVWNEEGRLMKNVSVASSQNPIYGLAVDTTLSRMYVTLDTQIQVYDINSGHFIRNFTSKTASPLTKLLLVDKNIILSSQSDKRLSLWDTESGALKTSEESGSTHPFLRDSILYSLNPGEKTIKSYKASTLSLDKVFVGGRVEFYRAAAGPKSLYAVGNDFRIRQWDLTTGQLVRIYDEKDEVASMVVTLDDRVIVGTFTHSMNIWSETQDNTTLNAQDSKSMDLRLVLGITIPLVVLLLMVVVALIVHQRRTKNKNNNQDDMNAYLPAYVKAAKENAKSSPPRKKWFDWLGNKPASSSLESNVPSATSSDTLHSDSHPLHSCAPLLAQEGIPDNDIPDKRQSGIPLNA